MLPLICVVQLSHRRGLVQTPLRAATTNGYKSKKAKTSEREEKVDDVYLERQAQPLPLSDFARLLDSAQLYLATCWFMELICSSKPDEQGCSFDFKDSWFVEGNQFDDLLISQFYK